MSEDEKKLNELRSKISVIDDKLMKMIGIRREMVLEIGRLKEKLGMPVMDPSREAVVVRRCAEKAREEGLDPELVRDVIWRIIASARDAQEGRTSWGPPDPPEWD